MWAVIAGGVITIFVATIFEYWRAPKIALSVETPPPRFESQGHFPERTTLRIIVSNRAFPFLAIRSSALRCRGRITFHDINNGQPIFAEPMEARWAGSPEPVPLTIIGPGVPEMVLWDPGRITMESRIDIYPGDSELLDVAVRFEGEEDCHGWNNESYFHNWRHPRYILSKGQYLMQVIVICSGKRKTELYRLMNDTTRADFRLEPATAEERLKGTASP